MKAIIALLSLALLLAACGAQPKTEEASQQDGMLGGSDNLGMPEEAPPDTAVPLAPDEPGLPGYEGVPPTP